MNGEKSIKTKIIFFYFYISGLSAEGHTIEYIVSARGKIQLVIDSYAFFRNKSEVNRETYYCNQYKTLK